MNRIVKKLANVAFLVILIQTTDSYAMMRYLLEGVGFVVVTGILVAHHCHAGFTHSPLYLATKSGDLKQVKQIVEKGGIDLDKEEEGDYLILVAARNGHEEIVKYFIEKGANLRVIDKFKKGLAFYATSAGLLDITKYLFNEGIFFNGFVRKAILHENLSVTKYLFTLGFRDKRKDIHCTQGSETAKYILFITRITEVLKNSDKNSVFIEQYLNLKDKELSKQNLSDLIGILGRLTGYDFGTNSKFFTELVSWMKVNGYLKFNNKFDQKWSLLNFAYLPKDDDDHIKYVLIGESLKYLKPTMSSNFNKEISCFIKHMSEWEDKKFSKEKQLVLKKGPRLSWKKMRREKNKILQQAILFGICAKEKHFFDIKIKHAI